MISERAAHGPRRPGGVHGRRIDPGRLTERNAALPHQESHRRTCVKLGVAARSLLALLVATAAAASQTITWVSVSADRTESGGGSTALAVSDDGRFVAFRSGAALAPGSNGPGVYVKDAQTGSVDIVSVASDGTQANTDGGGSPGHDR